jgi:hypothetical protein
VNPSIDKIEVEPVDDNHVRLKIRNGSKIVELIVRVTSEQVANIIESEQEHRDVRPKKVAAAG